MASFPPNPNDENELWIERAAFEDSMFRIWHLMFFAFSGIVALRKFPVHFTNHLSTIRFSVILICCCFKFRIPRTKQDIEADYQRKKLAVKFRERLKLIQNQDMDSLDLKRALEIIQEDYKEANQNIELQVCGTTMAAEPQKPIGAAVEKRSWRL